MKTSDYITELERENAALAQKRNQAVKDLDTLITGLAVNEPLQNLARKIQKNLKGN